MGGGGLPPFWPVPGKALTPLGGPRGCAVMPRRRLGPVGPSRLHLGTRAGHGGSPRGCAKAPCPGRAGRVGAPAERLAAVTACPGWRWLLGSAVAGGLGRGELAGGPGLARTPI